MQLFFSNQKIIPLLFQNGYSIFTERINNFDFYYERSDDGCTYLKWSVIHMEIC